MNFKRLIVPLINLSIFVVAGAGLYVLGNRHAPSANLGEAEQADERIPTAVPVHVGNVVRTTLHRVLTFFGRVEPAPASTSQPAGFAAISVPQSALVSEVNCLEGQHVEKGQLLFKLDPRSTNLQIQQAQAIAASCIHASNAIINQADTPKWMAAFANWAKDLAQTQVDRTQAEAKLLSIPAPISGTISSLKIHPGEIANPSAAALEIVDLQHLAIALDIPGPEVASIQMGQRAWIDATAKSSMSNQPTTQPSFAANSIESLESRVIKIDPAIDPATGMASVDVSLPPGISLQPGQFISARIETETHADCLAVPAESIVRDAQQRPRIAVVNEHDLQATLRYVTLGIRQADMVEILGDDLEVGQPIVTGGAYGISNRSGIVILGK